MFSLWKPNQAPRRSLTKAHLTTMIKRLENQLESRGIFDSSVWFYSSVGMRRYRGVTCMKCWDSRVVGQKDAEELWESLPIRRFGDRLVCQAIIYPLPLWLTPTCVDMNACRKLFSPTSINISVTFQHNQVKNIRTKQIENSAPHTFCKVTNILFSRKHKIQLNSLLNMYIRCQSLVKRSILLFNK